MSTIFGIPVDLGGLGLGPIKPAPGAEQSWMNDTYEQIKWRTLRQICLPFSHDSGMSQVRAGLGSFSFAIFTKAHVITQDDGIYLQLMHGARFFDIRPVAHGDRANPTYYCSHGFFANIPSPFNGLPNVSGGNWIGAAGQSLDDVCNDINKFTTNHNELIIIELSHAIQGNIDAGVGAIFMADMTQYDYNLLFNYLRSKIHFLYCSTNANVDLTQLPMSDFLGQKTSAVIFTISVDGIEIPDEFHGAGFYYGVLDSDPRVMVPAAIAGRRSQLYYNGGYSNSFDPNHVESDQFSNLTQFRELGDWTPPFLLEMTLTEQADSIMSTSIREGAALIRPKLQDITTTNPTYPTMIGVDFFDRDVTHITTSINQQPRNAGDNWSCELISAYWRTKDVTASLKPDFENWISCDRRATAPYQGQPYSILVSNTNSVLGPDPAPGVAKRLCVIINKYYVKDPCQSYLIRYIASDFETMILDPREMNFALSFSSERDRMDIQTQNGPTVCEIVRASWRPINPGSLSKPVPANLQNIGLSVGQPVSTLPITNFDVNYEKIQGSTARPTAEVLLLQIVLAQYCPAGLENANKAMSMTYTNYSVPEGGTMLLTPHVPPPPSPPPARRTGNPLPTRNDGGII